MKNNIEHYYPRIAYPTIILTIVSAAVYVSASVAAVNGQLSIGWLILINSIAAYLLFTPMHEAGHYNIASKRSMNWINEIIGWISGIPLFSPFHMFRTLHFRHHAFTNHPEKDPDHWLASKNLLSLIFHSTTIFPVYLIKGLQLLQAKQGVAESVKKEVRVGFIGLFFQLALLVALGISLGWMNILYIWVIPAVIAQSFLALTFDWLPHHPHEEKDRFKNSRIIDIPGLAVLFQGQNYHLIHHLYPRVPFYDYGKVYFEMKEELEEKGVEVVKLN